MAQQPRTVQRNLLLGLLGAPIRHSASPAMHEAAAASVGLRAYYHLIEVPGAAPEDLRLMLEGVRRLGFAGINITFPYKEAVVPLLDELSPGAAAIGAVNTVVVRAGKLVGHNTDSSGFAHALGEMGGAAGARAVALIGAGGVGRAIAFALADRGIADLRIFDHDHGKAAELVEALGERAAAWAAGSIAEALEGAGGLVNATPVGMLPNRDSPIPVELLRRDLWVADAVYTPLWTPLLLAARAAGAAVMTGRELAIFQALDAFELFCGVRPSREVMSAAFDAAMERRAARPRRRSRSTQPQDTGSKRRKANDQERAPDGTHSEPPLFHRHGGSPSRLGHSDPGRSAVAEHAALFGSVLRAGYPRGDDEAPRRGD
jgi:shikimate dehydrogenase